MWPKHGNPEIARNLPRNPGLHGRRIWDTEEKTMAYNSIVYNNLLHEREAQCSVEDFIAAVSAFCEAHNISILEDRMISNYGNGGWDRNNGLRIRVNSRISGIEQAICFVHEIVHCLAHVVDTGRGYAYTNHATRPVWEAEAYITSFRVASYFFQRLMLTHTLREGAKSYDMVQDFNNRLFNYGPKRHVEMIREEQCVEFADDLILWILIWLEENGKI